MFVKLKSIFKIAPYLLVVCCILLISYFVLYLQDEELSEDAKEFFTSSQVTLENNFYVRWSDIPIKIIVISRKNSIDTRIMILKV